MERRAQEVCLRESHRGHVVRWMQASGIVAQQDSGSSMGAVPVCGLIKV